MQDNSAEEVPVVIRVASNTADRPDDNILEPTAETQEQNTHPRSISISTTSDDNASDNSQNSANNTADDSADDSILANTGGDALTAAVNAVDENKEHEEIGEETLEIANILTSLPGDSVRKEVAMQESFQQKEDYTKYIDNSIQLLKDARIERDKIIKMLDIAEDRLTMMIRSNSESSEADTQKRGRFNESPEINRINELNEKLDQKQRMIRSLCEILRSLS